MRRPYKPAFGDLLFWLYGMFMAGWFLFPEAPEHYRLFYVFVVLPVLLFGWKQPQPWHGNPLFGLLLAYVVYMTSSALWSVPMDWLETGRVAWYGLLVMVFIFASGLVQSDNPARFDALLRALVLLAGMTALVSLLLWYAKHPFPASRLEPLNRMSHPILAGCVYGFFAILALHFFQVATGRAGKLLFAAATALLVATVLFTQSRTAIVSLLVAMLLLAGFRGRLLIASLTGAFAVFLLLEPGFWERLLRGLSHRPGIWLAAWQHALEQPWFGAGYLAPTDVRVGGRTFVHAHNAYLATLRDGGVVGLLLLLAVLAAALRCALRRDRYNGHWFFTALLVYAMLCAVPDLDRLLTRPKEHWLFFWLPLALLAAGRCGGRAGEGDQVRSPRHTLT
jgi:O-antigen ligase